MASMTYGASHVWPSIRKPPVDLWIEVCATTRTVPLIWIASASTVRSSWITSIREYCWTRPVDSVT